MGESFQDYSWIQNLSWLYLESQPKMQNSTDCNSSLLRLQFFWIWDLKKMLIVCTGFVMGNGKKEFQDFFIFQGLNFFPISYKTMWKNALFQPKISKWKGALVFFDSDSGDKNLDYHTNWIEYESHLALGRVSSDFHSVLGNFTKFFCASHKSERTRILYFSRINSYFQGWFYKIQGQFKDKGHFFQIPGPRSNSRTFPGLCEPCLYILRWSFKNSGFWKF